MLIFGCADHSGRAMKDTKILHRLKHWDRGFESQSSHGCLRLFCVCAVLCVGSGLATELTARPRSRANCLHAP
jgi:hypothetical protein